MLLEEEVLDIVDPNPNTNPTLTIILTLSPILPLHLTNPYTNPNPPN